MNKDEPALISFEKLNIPTLQQLSEKLATKGKLTISDNNLVYLDVDDDYIHQLFPLLEDQNIQKPDYFGIGLAGAHISVIYPEENISVGSSDLYKQHQFDIKGVFTAEIGLKQYYALLINAPSLLQLRRKYGVSDMLPFKGYLVDFHITIGVQIVGR